MGQVLVIAFPSLFAATVSLALAVLALRRSETLGAGAFAAMMTSAAVWSIGVGMSNVAGSQSGALAWFNLSQAGALTVVPFWFILADRITARRRAKRPWRYAVLFVLPVILLLYAWFVPYPNALRAAVEFESGPFGSVLRVRRGPLFFVELIYAYALLLVSVALLVAHHVVLPRETSYLLIAIALPIASNVLDVLGLNPLRRLGPTSMTFSLAGLIIMWGIFRHGLLNLMPVAHAQVFEAVTDPILVLDANDVIVAANPAARTLSEARAGIVGVSLERVLPQLRAVRRASSEASAGYELEVIRPEDRRIFSVRESAWSGSGVPAGRVLVFHDITQRTRMETALRESNDALVRATQRANELAGEAERLSAARGDFLAAMSHEIRTPLNGLVSMANLLYESELPPLQHGYVSIIKTSADILTTVVDQTLDLARIEAGKLQIDSTRFDVYAIVRESMTLAAARTTPDVRYAVSIDPNVPAEVVGDPVRVRQVLLNLLANAFKFTQQGEVTLHASVQQRNDTEVVVAFDVTDTGIGIPQDQLSRLFTPFQQVQVGSAAGSGLGLAISKQLVERMGGQIHVRSEVGRGSHFQFSVIFQLAEGAPATKASASVVYARPASVPVAPAQSVPAPRVGASGTLPGAEERARSVADEKPAAQQPRVLLVEDNELNRLVALSILRSIHYPADWVPNGAEAVSRLRETSYEVVLMDCQMPIMDGFEATRRIRAGEAGMSNKSIPIVALTAHALPGDRERCMSCGMDEYLTKPVKPVDLDRVLERWLGGNPALFDWDAFVTRLMGDVSVATEVIGMFLDTVPHRIEELAAALDAGDYDAVAARAHAIKGAAANLGASDFREAAMEVERRAETGLRDVIASALTDLQTEYGRLQPVLQRFRDQPVAR